MTDKKPIPEDNEREQVEKKPPRRGEGGNRDLTPLRVNLGYLTR